jgi:deoxycytidine triphosphate deaminase
MSIKTADWINVAIKQGVVLMTEGESQHKPLVESIDVERLSHIEGSSLDLTIDLVYTQQHPKSLFIGNGARVVPKMEVLPFDERKLHLLGDDITFELPQAEGDIPVQDIVDYWTLDPGKYYLLQSKEVLNIPMNIAAVIDTKTTLFRGQLSIDATWAHPNYQGPITVGVRNNADVPAYIQKGARIVSVHFFDFALSDHVFQGFQFSTHPYGVKSGAWQHGGENSYGKRIGPT